MDGIKQQIQAKQHEALDTKHMYETRRKNRQLAADLNKINESHKSTLTRVKKEFSKTELSEQNKLKEKLSDIRSKNQKIIKSEELRFKKMIEEIKMSQKEKVVELKVSQDKEIEKVETDHREYLDTARDKFEEEKIKVQA